MYMESVKMQLQISVFQHIVFSILWLEVFVESAIVKYTFNISYGSGYPDGVFSKTILQINGQFPGPTIEAFFGDTLEIDVNNQIQDNQSTSLHWHGIHQLLSIFEDGPSMITQCPIKVGRTQRYRFKLMQIGTFWYHGHVHSQYSEGLWGALIIRNRSTESNSYQGEFTISLSDWYHNSAKINEDWYLTNKIPGQGPPIPHSLLMNGFGRYPCNTAIIVGRSCSINKQFRQVFNVQTAKIVRLRLINASSRTTFNFSVDNHLLEVIEMDGEDVANVTTEIVEIAPGQRYSFLLRRPNYRNQSDFIIRAAAINESFSPFGITQINKYPDAIFREVTSVLRYIPVFPRSPVVRISRERFTHLDNLRTSPNRIFWDESMLIPRLRKDAPSSAQVNQRIILNTTLIADSEGIVHPSFNSTLFSLPTNKPILYSLLDNDPLNTTTFPYIQLKYGSVVEIVLNNLIGAHPFHLHGHMFWIVRRGKIGTQPTPFDKNGSSLRQRVPVRDTVFLRSGEWVVLRFIAANPGVWTFHCHIDWHNLGGMSLVFIEGVKETRIIYKNQLQSRRRNRNMSQC